MREIGLSLVMGYSLFVEADYQDKMKMLTDEAVVTKMILDLPDWWIERLDLLDHAFQPIVDINNGLVMGQEVLLRNWSEAGFDSIADVFNRAYKEDLLFSVDVALRRKALNKFKKISNYQGLKLFYNIDGRVWHSPDYDNNLADKTWEFFGIEPYSVCFEISEQQPFEIDESMLTLRDFFKRKGYRIAVDDCGAGFSGLQTMYYGEPDFVKIDRFFIQDVARNPKKRIFVSSIVTIAHSTGAMIIAEGVESKEDYYKCREIGCDYVQGYFVARPSTNIDDLLPGYEHVRQTRKMDRRSYDGDDSKFIDIQMTRLEPMYSNDHAFSVFTKFQNLDGYGTIPIINDSQEPVGIVTEKSFKPFAYSRYGRDLLQNRAVAESVSRFVTRCPIADIRTPVERILELYSQDDDIEGIIITDNLKYAGFMDANSLLKAVNEKNLHLARDLNPLTKLPGNIIISEYITNALEDHDSSYSLIYFDFDNFKPFNDYNGFRRGDRVLLLFSQILRQRQDNSDNFLAHIGGDDFFMGIKNHPQEDVVDEVKSIIAKFAFDVKSFYNKDDLENGFIIARDRNEEERKFPLLTVSSVIVHLPKMRQSLVGVDEIDSIIARNKKLAKKSKIKYVVETLEL